MSDKRSSTVEEVWMIRPCEVYKAEYQDCKRWKNRVVQYYVDGKTTDCTGWLNDYNNCIAFRERKDEMAAEAVIHKEKERQKERLLHAHANDIWKYRTNPPTEWNAPLNLNKSTEDMNISS